MTTVQRPVARRARPLLGVVVVLCAVVGVLAACASDAAGAEVLLEPASSVGTNPFTASVAVTAVAEFPTDVRAVGGDVLETTGDGSAAAVGGTTPGLYGGSGQAEVCDTAQLVEFLEGDEKKAEAWAGVFDIEPESIGTFVGGLTPVFLTVDTRVTNHGFRDGRATAFTAVLEAGTAVLVDSRGVPRAKCGCGNPLTPAPAGSLDDVRYVGEQWQAFEPDEVIEVEAGAPVESFAVIDLDTGDPVEIPVGTGGADGTQGFVLISAPEFDYDVTTISTSPDGVAWTQVAQARDLPYIVAEGPDGWLGIGTRSEVYTSEDLVSWAPVGAQPVFDDFSAQDLAFGNGQYVLVGGYSTPQGDSLPGLFTSPDGTTWSRADLPAAIDDSHLLTVTYIDGVGFVASGGAHTIVSPDGESWEQAGVQEPSLVVAGGGGTILRSEVRADQDVGLDYSRVSVQQGLADPPAEVPTSVFEELPLASAAFGGGQFLAATYDGWGGSASVEHGVYTSRDGSTWELVSPWASVARVGDVASDVAYGTIPSGEDAAPPSVGGGTDLRNVDWANRAYEACAGIDDVQPVQFQDGGFESSLGFGGGSLGEITYGDADADGAEDALVPIACSAGTSAGSYTEFLVFSASPAGPAQLGDTFSGNYTAKGTIVGGGVQTTQDRFLAGDPACCPTGGIETFTWTFRNGQWAES